MFTVFIDDSGTDPKQAVAIASALVIPSASLIALEADWEQLKGRRKLKCFHASACVYHSSKEEFRDWSKCQSKRLVASVRHLTKRYGAKAISYAINKQDYDAVVSQEMREVGGKYHYTWAIRYVIDALDNWADIVGYKDPFQYIFDWIDPNSGKKVKAEIETVMAQKEDECPGRYEGHYDFKKSCEFPGLQCVDLVAWTCYQMAQYGFQRKPMHTLASQTFWNLYRFRQDQEWMFAVTQDRAQLERWAPAQINDPLLNQTRREWLDRYRERKKGKAHH